MTQAIAVHLVTTEKRNGKNRRQPFVEKFDTVTAARKEMRDYIRGWLDEGWLRVANPKPIRFKPMTLTVHEPDDDSWTITCTIVRTDGKIRLRPEPNLSE